MAESTRRTLWAAMLIVVIGTIPLLWYWGVAGAGAVGMSEPALTMPGQQTAAEGNLVAEIPFQTMRLFEQIAAVTGGFFLKPLHMILSVVIIWGLLRFKAPDLTAIRWALLFFLIGEAFCAINYLVFQHKSDLSEYLHSFGMVIGFGFAFFALFEGLDSRLIKFSAPKKRCAAVDLCGQCIKSAPAPCGARRMILLFLPIFLALASLLLVTNLQRADYATEILGTPYRYSWPVLYQLYEARFTALLTMVLFGAALAAMWLDRSQPVPESARIFAAAGLGALSFGILRFGLKSLYFNNLVWADFYEEATELIFVLAILAILLLFQQKLLGEAFPGGQKINLWKLYVK